MKILVTGVAGFIGFHLVKKLVTNEQYNVVGIDSINDYYDISLKHGRLKETGISIKESDNNVELQSIKHPNYKFLKLDLTDISNIDDLFSNEGFDVVINLAAQAGVRYSLENPKSYINSNLHGFFNILESCRQHNIKHLLYASSSSVYGLNEEYPLSEDQSTDHPISLYAATKKSNEVIAHSYSYLFNLPTTGLRFFTVYGPWGRPDMALFKFTKKILNGEPIDIYGQGKMQRDFTYVDDIVESISRLVEIPPAARSDWDTSMNDSSSSSAPFRILNIGRGSPVNLMDFISILEQKLNKKAVCNFLEMQPGDVTVTFADTKRLERLTKFTPQVDIKDGVSKFVDWYLEYYK